MTYQFVFPAMTFVLAIIVAEAKVPAGIPFADAGPAEGVPPQYSVQLSLDKNRFARADAISIDVRFCVGDGATARLVNPWFDLLVQLPAGLAVYNDKHEYLGNLFAPERSAVSHRDAGPFDRVYLAANTYIGAKLKRHIVFDGWDGPTPLERGHYFFQAVYYQSALNSDNSKAAFLEHAAVRSNVVEVDLTD